MTYEDFLEHKSQSDVYSGFEPLWMPEFLFPFQKSLVDWGLRKGKDAIFADCGLGKTPIQLVWAQNVVEKTNKRVLILTPLAVSHQTIQEANKFDIKANRSHEGKLFDGINVTNYEQLHKYNSNDFAGCVCDESSILKSYDGKTREEITEFMRRMPYRLLATATAAPNDWIELGTSSEALGELGHIDMLNRFFKNEAANSSLRRDHGETVKWRLKHHAEVPFWRWVSSWARALRRPSDLGFDDNGFILPPLEERMHLVEVKTPRDGFLFNLPAKDIFEQREERKHTIKERCNKVAELTCDMNGKEPALVWCHLNEEGDLLEKLIPDSIQISGKDSDERKEEKFMAFTNGAARVLVTKPKIGAWGMNWQHCSHITYFPDHSYEKFYQGIRRCWRFGQKKKVVVDIVTTEGEKIIMKNLKRKSDLADKMFSALVQEMTKATKIDRQTNNFTQKEEVPVWL